MVNLKLIRKFNFCPDKNILNVFFLCCGFHCWSVFFSRQKIIPPAFFLVNFLITVFLILVGMNFFLNADLVGMRLIFHLTDRIYAINIFSTSLVFIYTGECIGKHIHFRSYWQCGIRCLCFVLSIVSFSFNLFFNKIVVLKRTD